MASVEDREADCVNVLFINPKEEAIEAANVLLKIANNILNHPNDPKYRRIKVSNCVLTGKLLPVSGAMECLFAMGFKEESEAFSLPEDPVSMNSLTKVRDLITERKEKVTQAAVVPQQQLAFLRKITDSYEHVLIYEDVNLQEKARSIIPVSELKEKANNILCSMQEKAGGGLTIEDFILLELLAWFKQYFFSWVDTAPCHQCGGKTRAVGMVPPTPAESMYGGGRVENFLCSTCNIETRFPRYNHPGKLLETRKGRCGEWANCFTLCCRALGFEARYVLDWTDHVWTEVYSISQKKWLHCDPCENKCDKPLIYESGWGKKLTYIMAFSKEDIQDVTWRYSNKHQEVLARRNECDEKWLIGTLLRLRSERQAHLTEARKKVLLERTIRELVEFISPKEAGSGESTGRESGSLMWRLARGETGEVSAEPQVIKLTDFEKAAKQFHLKYCCATDKYVRLSDNNAVINGWHQLTFEIKDVIRKEEQDWKMVYLARKPGTDLASVTWKLDLTGSGLKVRNIQVEAHCQKFQSGKIMWRLCGDSSCVFLPPDGSRLETSDLESSTTLTLTAHLRGGEGDVAWQHTQLFRQQLSDEDFPFDISISFAEK